MIGFLHARGIERKRLRNAVRSVVAKKVKAPAHGVMERKEAAFSALPLGPAAKAARLRRP